MIYIQSNSERTMPHHFDVASAMYGAIDCGLEYRLTSFEEVQSGKFDNLIRTRLFIGSVEFMREVFNRVGLKDIRVPKNSNRKEELITLKEAHLRVSGGETIFIKPEQIKLFTGLILDGCKYSCLENLPEDTRVIVSDVFESPIESEWRIYIKNGVIEDARNYSGDVMVFPDEEYISEIIRNECNDFPNNYTIDVGVLENRDNVVIEFNDMWAIGNYGVPNDIYLRLLRERYFEIMRK